MSLIGELLISFMKSADFEIEISKKFNLERIIEKECYKALEEIKEIILNDELEDGECFAKIEKIVCLFESKGINCGSRHDF